MKETLEEFVRESFNRIKDELFTQHPKSEYETYDFYEHDYLHVMNHATQEEEKEIREILKNIDKEIERIYEIQDDIYGR